MTEITITGPDAYEAGRRVSLIAIPQVCAIAQQFAADEKLFWYAFFTGLTGAACAGIGMPALREMFEALQQTFADAEPYTNPPTSKH